MGMGEKISGCQHAGRFQTMSSQLEINECVLNFCNTETHLIVSTESQFLDRICINSKINRPQELQPHQERYKSSPNNMNFQCYFSYIIHHTLRQQEFPITRNQALSQKQTHKTNSNICNHSMDTLEQRSPNVKLLGPYHSILLIQWTICTQF